MSMGGLAVAIGLVIDDAVVVVENIHRRAGEGGSSVVDAVQQLMAPLVSSTLTTVVVFAPLGLLSGVPGQFFRALSMSLSVAVLISLALVDQRRAADGAVGGGASSADGRVARPARPRLRAAARVDGRPARCSRSSSRVLLAALTAVLFYRVGHRLLSGRRRRRLRPRLPDAGRQRAGRNRSAGARDRASHRGRRRKSPPIRGGPDPSSACSPRRRTPATSSFASSRAASAAARRTRSSATCATRVHEAAPLVDIEFVQLLQDMLGDLEGNPEPIEVEDLRRRSRSAGGARRARRGDDEQGRRRRRRRRRAAGQSRR